MKMMKKMVMPLLLAAIMVISCSIGAFALTTTLTTTVPPATYELSVPANYQIDYATEITDIGELKVETSDGFGVGKDLKLSIVKEDFKCPDTNTTIPYSVYLGRGEKKLYLDDGASAYFTGKSTGAVEHYVEDNGTPLSSTLIQINKEDWSKTLAGEYTAVITYVTEVVVE